MLITTAAVADNSISLQVAAKSEHNDPKGSVQEVQQRWMEISARAFHLEQPGKVRIEWAFYGDDLSADKVAQHGSGTETIELAQGKTMEVKTKAVTFDFTPRHSVKSGSGRRAKFKTVEAAGNRYHGWGVRAYVGDKLAGESYSSPDIKRRMDGSN